MTNGLVSSINSLRRHLSLPRTLSAVGRWQEVRCNQQQLQEQWQGGQISLSCFSKPRSVERKLTVLCSGNPLDCDCHLSYLHGWIAAQSNSSAVSSTALCATPPALANAPLASLPAPPSCSEEQLDSQMDMPRADYYEYYYSEPGSDSSPTFLSSAELQLASSSYHPNTGKLSLVWQLEEAALPYTCGQLHVFQESLELGPVLVLQNALDCSSESQPSPSLLPVTVDLAGHNLSLTEAYIFCISLLQVITFSMARVIPTLIHRMPQ